MSGITGNGPIKSRKEYRELFKEIKEMIRYFHLYVNITPTGSYFSDVNKREFGDIDLILVLDASDKKEAKKELINFLLLNPVSVIMPFESNNDIRHYNSGEIITVSYKGVQVDFIIALDKEEARFKKHFLDMPAEKQGLALGLIKTILLEKNNDEIFKHLGITHIDINKNQELEFNLSSSELQLRLVTYEDLDSYKQIKKEIVWRSKNYTHVEYLLEGYDLTLPFEELVDYVSEHLKNPRSKKRINGLFKSMVSVKSGEVGKEKGYRKLKALELVEKKLGGK